MLRIFFNFFLIFLINERVSAIYPTEFLNAKNIISWGNSISNKILSNEVENNFDTTSMQNLEKTFSEIINISNNLENYSKKINEIEFESRDKVVHKIRNNSFAPKDQIPLNKLNSDVDRLFDDAHNLLRSGKKISDKSFENFAARVLDGSSNLPNILDNIHQLVMVSSYPSSKLAFIELLYRDAYLNMPQDCNRYNSMQEILFFFYGSLIKTEMKGLVILIYAHLIRSHINKSSNYLSRVSYGRGRFEARIYSYRNEIHRVMKHFPRVIHRCEVYPVQRDFDFIEFVKYDSVMLITLPTAFSRTAISLNSCNRLNRIYAYVPFATKISNCLDVSKFSDVQLCSADPSSPRRYLWWETAQKIYGHKGRCPNMIVRGNGIQMEQFQTSVCACSATETIPSNNNVVRLSTTPQMSDIKNNMIVVGVKFVTYDKAVHLQIQQSKFLPHDMDNNFTEWKKLDDHKANGNKKFEYKTLEEFSGQMYLDDVMLPPKHAVTGVQFLGRGNRPPGFYLQVHGTPFDLYTGKLDPSGSAWFGPGEDWNYFKPSDYKRNRTEIKIHNLDDSSRCKGYDYDRETNKFIKFRHSSILSDAGQSTVPYLDAHSVESYPAFPLSGIGLFYRKKWVCGGYIAPRIFTIDISQYLGK